MAKVKDRWYKAAYQKLYGFMRSKHPEILQEYRDYLLEVKRRIQEGIDVLKGEN